MALTAAVFVALWTSVTGAGSPPSITAEALAAIYPGTLTIDGSHFLKNGTSCDPLSGVEFVHLHRDRGSAGPEDRTVNGADTSVRSWTDSQIQLDLQMGFGRGQADVVVDGISSGTRELYVYKSATFNDPVYSPVALDVSGDGFVWINGESHPSQFTKISPASTPTLTAIDIPQTSAGIFVWGEGFPQSRASAAAEDLDVAPDGSVFLTEGGWAQYAGTLRNASRIVRYFPTPTPGTTPVSFACYNAPLNSSDMDGVLIDGDTVWYTEGLPVPGDPTAGGNALTRFKPAYSNSTCLWDGSVPQEHVCAAGESVTTGCHQRFMLPTIVSTRTPTQGDINTRYPANLISDGQNVWVAEFFGNRVARFQPQTGEFNELLLPTPVNSTVEGQAVGGAPWEIERGADGDLWISEYNDATIDRIRPSACSAGPNPGDPITPTPPCFAEIYVDNQAGLVIHSLAVGTEGRIWFGRSSYSFAPNVAQVGFLSTLDRSGTPLATPQTALFPALPDAAQIAGIVEDPLTQSVWVTLHNIGYGKTVLLQPDDDADGAPTANDNCPLVANPGQTNNSADLIVLPHPKYSFDDTTSINSDSIGDACDTDADKDALESSDESALGPGHDRHTICPSASTDTDPLKNDTDGDRFLDGAECEIGTDPASGASHPTAAQCAARIGVTTSTDSDADGVKDYVEYCNYGGNYNSLNSDGDLCSDGQEVASLNNDRVVNSGDQGLVASTLGPSTGPNYVADFDVNKDGTINSGDQGFVASKIGACAARLAFTTQPSGASAGVPFGTQPVVSIQSPNGAAEATTLLVTLRVAGETTAELTCSSNTVAADNGVAQFAGCAINAPGNYQIIASAAGVAVGSAVITVN